MKKFGLIICLLSAMFASSVFAQDETENVEMQVVATKTARRIQDTAGDVTVITSEDLETRTGGTASDVLRDFGIVITDAMGSGRADGSKPSIRGFDAGSVLIIIDGQRIAVDAATGAYTLRKIPASSIERIEILEGPSSFLYGSDAMGGVIYITTKRGGGQQGLSIDFGASYGNNFKFEDDAHNTKEYFNLGYGFENGNSVYFGGSFEYGNAFVSDYNTYEGTIYGYNNTVDFINFGFNAGGTVNISDKQSLSISTFYNQDVSSIRELDPKQTYNSQEFIANLAYKLYALDNLDINI